LARVCGPLTRDVVIADSAVQAWELAEQYLLINYRDEYGGGWDHPLIDDEDATPVDRLDAVARDRHVIGAPDECIRHIQRFVDELGVDHFICRPYFPGSRTITSCTSCDSSPPRLYRLSHCRPAGTDTRARRGSGATRVNHRDGGAALGPLIGMGLVDQRIWILRPDRDP
jgi:hypothetical protein